MDYCVTRSPIVVYILGNREFHYGDLANTVDKLRDIMPPKVCILERASLIVDDNIEIFGTTLWTRSVDKDHSPRNYSSIMLNGAPASTTHTSAIYEESSRILFDVVRASQARIKIVVTHHMPIGPVMKETNPYKETPNMHEFHAMLDPQILLTDIDYWISGHTHFSHRVERTNAHGKRIVFLSNQMGYTEEAKFVGHRTDAMLTL